MIIFQVTSLSFYLSYLKQGLKTNKQKETGLKPWSVLHYLLPLFHATVRSPDKAQDSVPYSKPHASSQNLTKFPCHALPEKKSQVHQHLPTQHKFLHLAPRLPFVLCKKCIPALINQQMPGRASLFFLILVYRNFLPCRAFQAPSFLIDWMLCHLNYLELYSGLLYLGVVGILHKVLVQRVTVIISPKTKLHLPRGMKREAMAPALVFFRVAKVLVRKSIFF